MFDLAIGTKFYYNDDLVEVVKNDRQADMDCSECVFVHINLYDDDPVYCSDFKCSCEERKDKKDVIFKKVLDKM